ncbi:hypothetical protein AGMMS49975_29140 [Clostridia bacterium]|nr:hypothetical protein AGMMS49975_29140 [Clostridia bacterium]
MTNIKFYKKEPLTEAFSSAEKKSMINNKKLLVSVALTSSIGAFAIIASGIFMSLSFGGIDTDDLTKTKYLSAQSDVFPVTKPTDETTTEETESDVPAPTDIIESYETEGSPNKVVITKSDNGEIILRSNDIAEKAIYSFDPVSVK